MSSWLAWYPSCRCFSRMCFCCFKFSFSFSALDWLKFSDFNLSISSASATSLLIFYEIMLAYALNLPSFLAMRSLNSSAAFSDADFYGTCYFCYSCSFRTLIYSSNCVYLTLFAKDFVAYSSFIFASWLFFAVRSSVYASCYVFVSCITFVLVLIYWLYSSSFSFLRITYL